MNNKSKSFLNPNNFLQTFVTQSIKIANQHGCSKCEGSLSHIDYLGMAASTCFEEAYRKQHALIGDINLAQYSDMIVDIKNQIGGNFSRATSDSGVLRVINTRCPFGEAVKEAPELCRMTSSVFGAIAARNFGYAKVIMNKRLALNDDICDVCIYTDRDIASQYVGDEYENDSGTILAKTSVSNIVVRVDEELRKFWCHSKSDKKSEPSAKYSIIAESSSMQGILESVELIAPTSASVMITGETGVGKELIASAIHALSERSDKPFVAVNCGAIPENLVESALFGHERGAFTGAYNVHHGYFERADNGTLFLDEIDSLPVSAQARLLRILQEGKFERVGGRQTLKSDMRVISASNRDIESLISTGEFRQDLFYRLNVIPIHIPPLRERLEDLSALVTHLLRKLAESNKGKKKILSNSAWIQIMTYSWPGNVRELMNVLERSYLFSRNEVISRIDVGNGNIQNHGLLDETDLGGEIDLRSIKKKAALDLEKKIIQAGLSRFQGNVSQVARSMGITPRAVHQKLKVHGINPAVYRETQVAPSPDIKQQ
jgi:Nif-specific regulatory protein/two-component system response regulator AtoC